MPVFNKYLGIVTNGDTFCIALDDDLIPSVKNNGPQIATNVIVTITVPPGIEFLTVGSTISKGFFDEVLGKWNIGSLIKNESATASFCFEVTDACVLPYEIIFNVDSDACECQLNNNQLTATLDGISCCDVLECVTEDYIDSMQPYYTNSYVERLRALGSDVQFTNSVGSNITANSFSETLIHCVSIYVNKKSIINGVGWFQQTQGDYTADNYNGIGLYSFDVNTKNLTLIASTTNDGDIWKATGNTYSTKNFTTPIEINKGIYYVGLLYNFSAVIVQPIISAINTTVVNMNQNNIALPSNTFLAFVTLSPYTTLPTTISNTDIQSYLHYIFYLY